MSQVISITRCSSTSRKPGRRERQTWRDLQQGNGTQRMSTSGSSTTSRRKRIGDGEGKWRGSKKSKKRHE